VGDYSAAPKGAVVVWHDLANPPDLYLLAGNGGPRRLTSVNAVLLKSRTLGAFEQFSFKGWNDETVHGYVVKPFGFAADRKFPIAFVIHGGPQSSFQNQWNWRWNAQTFAARGYGTVFIDFHGSPGYGQAFTDSISQHWGDRPFEDLKKGLAAALQKYPWLDGARACSLGASYGGYMQNWIAGNWPDGFRCIVNHDGIFDTRSMYYTTEELWFTEWENGGPYYQAAGVHERFNPANHVQEWRTPMLVIHGGQDFRVPDTQGIATFTALQRRGIESKLLYFPDENHWVLKPNNSIKWYGTVLDWLDAHTRP
jgi:dipeptidyl aminopeptidase/acylaminoacyl peptidase